MILFETRPCAATLKFYQWYSHDSKECQKNITQKTKTTLVHSSIKGIFTNQSMDAKSLQNILELFLISSKNSTNTLRNTTCSLLKD